MRCCVMNAGIAIRIMRNTKSQHRMDDFENQNDLQSDVIQDGEHFNPPTDADLLAEKIRQLCYGDTETETNQQAQEKEFINVVIKNDKGSEDKCFKRKRRVINGIRCTSCKKAWHWRCRGATDEMTTTVILNYQIWECRLCRPFPPDDTEKNCPSYKILKTQITDLRRNITELENNLKHLSKELKLCNKRATDSEDRRYREKKLRQQVEKELEELKDQMDSGSTSSSDDSSYADTEWEDSNQITRKPKRPTNKHQRSRAKNHSDSKTPGQERQLVSEDGPKKSQEVEETLTYKQNQESNNRQNRNSQSTKAGRVTNAYECRTPTKLEMELEQEERQQIRNLQAAIEYLEKYGHGHGSKIEMKMTRITTLGPKIVHQAQGKVRTLSH